MLIKSRPRGDNTRKRFNLCKHKGKSRQGFFRINKFDFRIDSDSRLPWKQTIVKIFGPAVFQRNLASVSIHVIYLVALETMNSWMSSDDSRQTRTSHCFPLPWVTAADNTGPTHPYQLLRGLYSCSLEGSHIKRAETSRHHLSEQLTMVSAASKWSHYSRNLQTRRILNHCF